MRGRHFKREIKVLCKWRENKNFAHFSVEEDQKGTFRQHLKEVKPENVFPLFLNLVSCFLFMMNNYIIEPSSAYYAEALGSSDALSGIMIGMAPWFAIISSIAYSYWTNFEYKKPILFAGLLQFAGNLMYANAYGYQSIEMCLIGRAITGLGAPRVINRRYVFRCHHIFAFYLITYNVLI
jgi:MFS family permease